MEDQFPGRLRALRRKKGVSCKVVGDFCGLSKSAICQYEKGMREPGISAVVKLANYFEVSTDYLLGLEK